MSDRPGVFAHVALFLAMVGVGLSTIYVSVLAYFPVFPVDDAGPSPVQRLEQTLASGFGCALLLLAALAFWALRAHLWLIVMDLVVACLLGLAAISSATSEAPSDYVPDTDPWPWVAQTFIQTWTTLPMLVVLASAAWVTGSSYLDRRALRGR